MSEIKLNLIDSQTILTGTIHGSVGDRCVAALSAEPETIKELESALSRYERCPPNLSSFPTFIGKSTLPLQLDTEPYDAGILIIDLAARIVACNSTYSQPGPEGQVEYHDGTQCTCLPILYRVPDDWLFLNSVEEYEALREERREQRAATPPFDARAILYGRPLLEFIAANVRHALASRDLAQRGFLAGPDVISGDDDKPEFVEQPGDCDPLSNAVTGLHTSWLLTPRDDLRGHSPREIMLDKQDLINSDLNSRMLQWSFQLEGPPCLPPDSFAYRFAGFGSHEWFIYYDLVRYLLWSAMAHVEHTSDPDGLVDLSTPIVNHAKRDDTDLLTHLEQLKNAWLTEPNDDLEGRIPFVIIDNERKRLPEAMGGRSMVVDEDCPICKMMGDESEAGLEVCFWHLDGCNMDDGFAFSSCRTIEDWEAEQKRHDEFNQEWDRKRKEREERIARGEQLDPDPFFDPPALDEFVPWTYTEPDPPEA